MGDALGIGPEIIVRAALQGAFAPDALGPVAVLGSPAVLQRAAGALRERADVPALVIVRIDHPADLPDVPAAPGVAIPDVNFPAIPSVGISVG